MKTQEVPTITLHNGKRIPTALIFGATGGRQLEFD
jgi:hypothetical protein